MPEGPPELRLPFNRPSFVGRELSYVAEAVAGGHISGDGPFTKRCERILEEELGASRVLLTTSCTHALELAGLLLDLQPGDEVIMPAFTFVSTANAFALRGAVPVFTDIRPDTLNIDEKQIEALITERTRAIVVVHYGGIGCEMDAIGATARRYSLPIVEDNAHGLFARYKGEPLGSFGVVATQSFHETKNLTCGEGGALVLNDPTLVERAEILREKGTNRSQFFRGQVDKYTWVGVGSSYAPSDLLAAYLLAQLEGRKSIQERRARIWHRYNEALGPWCSEHNVATAGIPVTCDSAYHLYYLVLPDHAQRARLIDHLKQRGILAVFHYQPLNRSPMGLRHGRDANGCPVTEHVADRLLRLPFFNDMSEDEQSSVIDGILEFEP